MCAFVYWQCLRGCKCSEQLRIRPGFFEARRSAIAEFRTADGNVALHLISSTYKEQHLEGVVSPVSVVWTFSNGQHRAIGPQPRQLAVEHWFEALTCCALKVTAVVRGVDIPVSRWVEVPLTCAASVASSTSGKYDRQPVSAASA